jgi:molybdenum cofactor synthesis domain-containing protein
MTNSDNPTAGVIIIGNEILSGKTQDTNLQFIGNKLAELGVRLERAVVIPDIETIIVSTVNDYRARYRYVFTTGGIGPTHDDITSACVAKAFNVALVEDPEAVRRLQRNYKRGELSKARLKMAQVPAGASLIDNPISQAPGFRMDNVFVLAGIPAVAQAMFDHVALQVEGGPAIVAKSVDGYLAESAIASQLADIDERYPAIDIGCYPFFRNQRFGANVVARGTDAAAVHQVIEEVFAVMVKLGGEPERPA